jgi:hypothetical protein
VPRNSGGGGILLPSDVETPARRQLSQAIGYQDPQRLPCDQRGDAVLTHQIVDAGEPLAGCASFLPGDVRAFPLAHSVSSWPLRPEAKLRNCLPAMWHL